jgi:hypothetical protein
MSLLIPFGYRETVQAIEQLGGRVQVRLTPKRVVVEVHRERRDPLRSEFRQTRLAEMVEGWLASVALPTLREERSALDSLVVTITAESSRVRRGELRTEMRSDGASRSSALSRKRLTPANPRDNNPYGRDAGAVAWFSAPFLTRTGEL